MCLKNLRLSRQKTFVVHFKKAVRAGRLPPARRRGARARGMAADVRRAASRLQQHLRLRAAPINLWAFLRSPRQHNLFFGHFDFVYFDHFVSLAAITSLPSHSLLRLFPTLPTGYAAAALRCGRCLLLLLSTHLSSFAPFCSTDDLTSLLRKRSRFAVPSCSSSVRLLTRQLPFLTSVCFACPVLGEEGKSIVVVRLVTAFHCTLFVASR